MQVNDQISKYQAEFYTESVHDAYINVQRLLNKYTQNVISLEDSINNEIKYRKQSKKERMKKPAAVLLLLLGLIFLVVTVASFGVGGYSAYLFATNGTLPSIIPFTIEPLYLAIIGLVAGILFLIITINIFKRRALVGRKLNLKKAQKELEEKKEITSQLTATITSYPTVYERVHKLLVRTKKNPLGKLIINAEDKETIDIVKHFTNVSEEATSKYIIK